eukprot:PLAT3336.6.p1 GENE.PLAT3336.6~~PLAT3336.6.p1  ORF type:complete len:2053 (+),score=1160.82 PLAT3336.6:683-6160(+)
MEAEEGDADERSEMAAAAAAASAAVLGESLTAADLAAIDHLLAVREEQAETEELLLSSLHGGDMSASDLDSSFASFRTADGGAASVLLESMSASHFGLAASGVLLADPTRVATHVLLRVMELRIDIRVPDRSVLRLTMRNHVTDASLTKAATTVMMKAAAFSCTELLPNERRLPLIDIVDGTDSSPAIFVHVQLSEKAAASLDERPLLSSTLPPASMTDITVTLGRLHALLEMDTFQRLAPLFNLSATGDAGHSASTPVAAGVLPPAIDLSASFYIDDVVAAMAAKKRRSEMRLTVTAPAALLQVNIPDGSGGQRGEALFLDMTDMHFLAAGSGGGLPQPWRLQAASMLLSLSLPGHDGRIRLLSGKALPGEHGPLLPCISIGDAASLLPSSSSAASPPMPSPTGDDSLHAAPAFVFAGPARGDSVEDLFAMEGAAGEEEGGRDGGRSMEEKALRSADMVVDVQLQDANLSMTGWQLTLVRQLVAALVKGNPAADSGGKEEEQQQEHKSEGHADGHAAASTRSGFVLLLDAVVGALTFRADGGHNEFRFAFTNLHFFLVASYLGQPVMNIVLQLQKLRLFESPRAAAGKLVPLLYAPPWLAGAAAASGKTKPDAFRLALTFDDRSSLLSRTEVTLTVDGLVLRYDVDSLWSTQLVEILLGNDDVTALAAALHDDDVAALWEARLRACQPLQPPSKVAAIAWLLSGGPTSASRAAAPPAITPTQLLQLLPAERQLTLCEQAGVRPGAGAAVRAEQLLKAARAALKASSAAAEAEEEEKETGAASPALSQTALFVHLSNFSLDYAPPTLTSRCVLQLAELHVSSTFVSGTPVTTYRIVLEGAELYLIDLRPLAEEAVARAFKPPASPAAAQAGDALARVRAAQFRRSRRSVTSAADHDRALAASAPIAPLEDSRAPASVREALEAGDYIRVLTIDRLSLLVRENDPLDDKAADMDVELELNLLAGYTCTDSLHTLVTLASEWWFRFNGGDATSPPAVQVLKSPDEGGLLAGIDEDAFGLSAPSPASRIDAGAGAGSSSGSGGGGAGGSGAMLIDVGSLVHEDYVSKRLDDSSAASPGPVARWLPAEEGDALPSADGDGFVSDGSASLEDDFMEASDSDSDEDDGRDRHSADDSSALAVSTLAAAAALLEQSDEDGELAAGMALSRSLWRDSDRSLEMELPSWEGGDGDDDGGDSDGDIFADAADGEETEGGAGVELLWAAAAGSEEDAGVEEEEKKEEEARRRPVITSVEDEWEREAAFRSAFMGASPTVIDGDDAAAAGSSSSSGSGSVAAATAEEEEEGAAHWFGDEPLRIIPHYEGAVEARSKRKQGAAIRQRRKLHLVVREMNIRWRIFGGLDWGEDMPAQAARYRTMSGDSSSPFGVSPADRRVGLLGVLVEDAAAAAPDRLSPESPPRRQNQRQKGKYVDAVLSGVAVDLQLFHPGLHVTRTRLSVRELELIDGLRKSDIGKLLCYWRSEAHPREAGSPMLRLDADYLHPAAMDNCEYRIKLRLLPLRMHIDQDTALFLVQLANYQPRAAVVVAESDGGGSGADGMDDGTAGRPDAPLFFQHVRVNAVRISLDYVPKHVDLAALREGSLLEAINVFPISSLALDLRRVDAHGVSGLSAVLQRVAASWADDILQEQLHRCVASVGPLRGVSNIGAGVADLVLLPMEQFKKDRRLLLGLRAGASSFLKALSVETLNAASLLAMASQALLEEAEASIGSRRLGRSHRRRQLAKQPPGVRAGLRDAYDSLSRGFKGAVQTIVAVPVAASRGGAGRAVRTAVKAVPVAIIKPLIGVTEAFAKAALGARNELDPEVRDGEAAKYKAK